MKTAFRGEAVYTAEVDTHFPQLSVGDTLYFAALSRVPRQLPQGISRERYAEHLRNVRIPILSYVDQLIRAGCHGHVRYQSYNQHARRQRLCPWCERKLKSHYAHVL
jgi:hypothetical protein